MGERRGGVSGEGNQGIGGGGMRGGGRGNDILNVEISNAVLRVV